MVAVAAALWGLWGVVLRTADRWGPVSPVAQAIVVQVVVLVAVAPAALRSRPGRRRPAVAWAWLGFLGVSNSLNMVLFFGALQVTSVAIAVLTHYLAPVLVAVFSPLVFRDRPRRTTWLALGVALFGLALLLEPWRAASGRPFYGAALGAASAAFYAANVIVTKRIQAWLTPYEVLAWHAVPSLVVLWVFLPPGGLALASQAVGVIAAGSLVAGAFAGALFVRGLGAVPAPRAAVLTLLEPVVAVGSAAVVFAERPGPVAGVGSVLVLGAAWLVLRVDASVSPSA